MRIDSRYPDLDWFLQHWQRRLNRRLLVGEALVAWMVSATVTVGPLWWLTAAQPGLGPGLWVALTSAAALAYVVYRTRGRLNRSQAASWLDQRHATLGLFRAASECLDKENLGFADTKVLEDAELRRQSLRGEKPKKMPGRVLAMRAALAAAVSLGCLAFLGLVDPPRNGGGLPVTEPAKTGEVPSWQDPESDLPARELSPEEAAQRLFPEDSRMAALAEQALASGDPGALDALLEQNSDNKPGSRSSGTPPPQNELSPQDKGQAGGQAGGQSPAPGTPQEDQAGGQGSASGNQDKPSPDQRQPNSQTQPPGEGQKGRLGQDNPQQGMEGGFPGDSQGRGLAPGTGSSSQSLGQPLVRPPTQKKLPLKEKDNPPLFEYVLPGMGSKLPAAGALADSQRSAEAVISRTSPPLEFENTIRDYFLTLTQEVSP